MRPMGVTDGYHPRAVTLAGLFGPVLRRAWVIGMVAGVVAAYLLPFALGAEAHALVLFAGSALVVPVVTIAVGWLLVPRQTARAFEAFSWLGHREAARFTERTASPMPTSSAAIQAWLEANPPGPVTATARVELLAALGRLDEAAAELARLPAPADDLERLQQAGLRTYIDSVATGMADLAAFDTETAALPDTSRLRVEADVVRAVAEARLRAQAGEPDPLAPLARVRPRLGSEPMAIVARDTWLPVGRQALALGFVVGAINAVFAGS